MRNNSYLFRVISLLMMVLLPVMSIGLEVASAEILPTEVLLQDLASNDSLAEVKAFLARSEVKAELSNLGLSFEEVDRRLNALSPSELQSLAKNIKTLAAGGDGLGTVVGAIVLIFIVLLVTDILGLTKVFPFTRSVR